jgi:hypothetical protein
MEVPASARACQTRSYMIGRGNTHKAAELGPFPTTAFDNVLNADVCASQLLHLSTPRARDGGISTIAVAVVLGVSVDLRDTTMRAGSTTLSDRASSVLIVRAS